ncbi:MAG: MFS transporter [Bacteroidota bacterium]|nr:MFS transporter [Bacteroidota bacterium]
MKLQKDLQYYKFSLYGFLKNLRFFEPFLLLFFLANGISYTQIGLLFGLREILINVFEIPSGMFADTTGRRRTMVMSFAVYIAAFVVFYFSNGFWLFVVAMILYALGDAFRSGVHKAMIFHYLDKHGWESQKVNYYGHTRSWSQMGSALSALIAGLIVFYQGDYRSIFLFTIIPYVLDMLLLLSYPSWLDGEHKIPRWKHMKIQFTIVWRDFLLTFRSYHRIKAVLNVSVFSGFYKASREYLQAIIKNIAPLIPVLYGLEQKDKISVIIGITYFFIYIFSSQASRYSGRFANKFKTLNLPLNITLIAGLMMGLIAGAGEIIGIPLVAIVPFMLIIIIENLRKPMGVSHIASLTNSRIHASVLSVTSQVKSLSAALMSILLGVFSDLVGVGYAFIIISAVFIISSYFYRA